MKSLCPNNSPFKAGESIGSANRILVKFQMEKAIGLICLFLSLFFATWGDKGSWKLLYHVKGNDGCSRRMSLLALGTMFSIRCHLHLVH